VPLKILITGNLGYVGPEVGKYLRARRPDAALYGFDNAYFAHCLTGAAVLPESYLDGQFYGDVRNISLDLKEYDAVVQLAAISNDPMGNRFQAVTLDINHNSTVSLAKAAAAAGVKNFVFASSCSVYGIAEGAARKESDPLNPITAYARSKIGAERALSELETPMVITALRFATACGMSDRLRLDLVLNDFVACALSRGEISVLSDGSPWRPLIDVADMARAIDWAIDRPAGRGGRYLAVNVGSNDRNYQVKELANAVATSRSTDPKIWANDLDSDSDRLRPQRICLFGMFGGGNLGNDASLESFLLFLREARPDAEISCVCVDPDLIARQHQIPTTPISIPNFSNSFLRAINRGSLKLLGRAANWHRAINFFRQFDVVIVPGTSFLCDFGSGPFGTPYGLFRWAAAARLCGVKFCFVGTGAGPIMHPLSRWMCKSAAAWAYYRSFRDQVSKDFITSLGIDTSEDPVYPDLVFKLPTPSENAMRNIPSTIGVGLMNYSGWLAKSPAIYETYIEKISRFVVSLLDRGYRVRLLIGETVDQRAVSDVARVALANGYSIANGVTDPPKAGQLVQEPTNSFHDVMRQIADTDIVVATRFHNVICALKLMRPTVSIGYEAKSDAVMADAGLGDFCQFIEELDLEQLEMQFTELVKNKAHHQEIIRRNLEAIHGRVKRHEQELLSKIL
jgi:polysaccharide pyruvyl transferase WcaK-like protein/nucleoside-diphosphate-sugar epimerase